MFRVLTFLLNAFTLRFVSKELIGVVNVRWEHASHHKGEKRHLTKTDCVQPEKRKPLNLWPVPESRFKIPSFLVLKCRKVVDFAILFTLKLIVF